MSWGGIWHVHSPEGVDPQAAIDATVVGWITYDGEGVSMVPNVDPPVVPVDPGWSDLARSVLLDVNPNLRPVGDSGTLDDGIGPVWISVYSNEVQLKPKRGIDVGPDVDRFAVMWEYCVALASRAQCVAHDPEEDGLIDVGLDLETARRVYLW